ncbi:MAG: tRNA pseudouridine(55) synthase TruB [Acidobacteriota bacterium]
MDGILIIDKPVDWTSHDVVSRARRILRTRRIGHTGTLDPFATGVLVLCIGRFTRLAQFLSGEEKQYHAVMRLGFATDTGDLTGTAVEPHHDPLHISAADIDLAMNEFRGRIDQVPPMYAAKKVAGVRLYEMARRGEVIARKPVQVDIKKLEIDESTASLPPDHVAFRVVCSAGTYIRTLAEEIGQRLGVGAHLVSLRRTRAGSCVLKSALTLDQLEEEVLAGRLEDAFQPVTTILGFPVITLDEREERVVRNGAAVDCGKLIENGERAILCNLSGEPLAIAEFDAAQAKWQPRVVVAPDEAQMDNVEG